MSRITFGESVLGDHIISGIAGTALSFKERELFKELRPSGIIVFKHNISQSHNWPKDLHKLIEDVRDCTARETIFVGVDHEGGKVHRFPPPITHFPPAIFWRTRSFEVGQAMGRELRVLGINLNFAPVLDVFLESRNTVIAERAFDRNSDIVSEHAVQFMKGLLSSGIMPCGKHFPGHGRTIEDSHFELPILDISEEELFREELLPFRAVIANSIPMLMTAHVLYPQIDSVYPATFSPIVVEDILRRRCDFCGVVISDALEMGALDSSIHRCSQGNHNLGNHNLGNHNLGDYMKSRDSSLIAALMAGVDLALYATSKDCEPIVVAHRTACIAEDALSKGLLSEELCIASRRRINSAFMQLKRLDAFEQTSNFSVIECVEHIQLCKNIAVDGFALG